MNYQEDIVYLAQMNSRTCRPKRLEEIDTTIPYFSISKNSMGRYDMKSFAYENHDNAGRMPFIEGYLKQAIFPNISPDIDISGHYNIQLHDSYCYLNDGKDYKDVLVFSKFKNDRGPVLIPDPYMIGNYGNMLQSINDTVPWDKKMNKIIFCGTTTGNRNPILNERINLCKWAIDKRDYCDFYITKVAQMDPFYVQNTVTDFNKIYHNAISIPDQMKYKFHLAIDGNTCKFDVWYYKTSNVVMKYQSKEMLWYYPLLQADTHFTEVNKDNMQSKYQFFLNNPDHAILMMYNAQKLCSSLFRPLIHQIYTINLFENMALNN